MQGKRRALVTGAGRTNGIGAAICRELAQRGMDIRFTYWPLEEREEATAAVEALQEYGVNAEARAFDLSQTESIDSILEWASEGGTLQVLVNNATYSLRDINYQALTPEILDQHYAVNLRAPLLLSAAFADRCPENIGGRIISMTSGQSLGGMPGEIAYAATKGGIDAFTRTLAAEVAAKGITVNAVNPGPTDTGWVTPEIRRELLPYFPFGRLGEPKDAARLVAFLASEEASWITGQILHSEGGFMSR
ncbi:SDR family oxidoreductase [Desmospora activa]|uniref:3-oxoacyl-[acyl-carrier protein] reductase n=1 Tax=Desmospora activa DSM 45169 TaxID=1121389 RepID=A0A2T4ZAB9_9BACL|nr:SDR family oxidoreductase [Desmospora activa]PTM58805.1 3-oxoacyl-[acyl-carrier protein] reductase [Desmospora activa DSM 45169]